MQEGWAGEGAEEEGRHARGAVGSLARGGRVSVLWKDFPGTSRVVVSLGPRERSRRSVTRTPVNEGDFIAIF